MDIAADLAMEAKLHTRTVGKSAVSGFRDFGGELVHQMFGGGNKAQLALPDEQGSDFVRQLLGGGNSANVTDDQLANLNSDDKAFSDTSYMETRARVMAIYEEHRQKRLKEEEEKRQKEREQNTQEMAKLRGETRAVNQAKNQDIRVAMGKASAETGKSYGAE